MLRGKHAFTCSAVQASSALHAASLGLRMQFRYARAADPGHVIGMRKLAYLSASQRCLRGFHAQDTRPVSLLQVLWLL
jgi:hypothetical protein